MRQLQKITADTAMSEGLRCAFCNRAPSEGSDLIAGPDVVICDECVAGCNDLLAESDASNEETSPEGGDERDVRRETASSRQTFFRILSEGDVADLIATDDLIDAMEATLPRFSGGEVIQPARTVLATKGERDFLAVMPAYLPAGVQKPAILGTKLITMFHENAGLDLPTHLPTVLLFSADTGALLAVVGGRYITAACTAAVSAVSAKLLAHDDAGHLAIIGSGAHARSHLQALERIFELSSVSVWSPTPEHQAAFIEEMKSATRVRLDGADSAGHAVREADLIVLATSSCDPVIQQEWIRPGTHVMSVGACRPDQREMDPALVKRARLFVDSRATALAESGDVVLGIREHLFTASHIVGELGDVIANRVEGRRSPRDVTIFKSLGLAVEDVVAADLAYRRAVTQDAGRELEL